MEDLSDFIEIFFEVNDPWATFVSAQYMCSIRQYSVIGDEAQIDEGETGAVSALINVNIPIDEEVDPDVPEIDPEGISTGTAESSKYLVKPGQLKVFPNPAQDKIGMQSWEQKGINRVSIYDELGKLVKQIEYEGFDNQQVIRSMDISDLKHGFYLVIIDNEHGTLQQRFVKN